jgi:ubiquinone/menaquinone biosynthesis C-methylase UbiE
MVALQRLRASLRPRFCDPLTVKHDAELRWWLQHWDPVIRAGGFNPGDALAFLDHEDVEPTYLGRRWQQARAEVRRVLREAAIDDARFFDGKVVVDVGPGPRVGLGGRALAPAASPDLGFPDACSARVSIGVDPLAERFAEHGLLIPNSSAVYLSTGAEHIPLVRESVDVVLARNSLDHVDDPEQVLEEGRRILRPGGTLILHFDVEHRPTPTEPHTLTAERVRSALGGMTVVHEHESGGSFGREGHSVVLVAEKPDLATSHGSHVADDRST